MASNSFYSSDSFSVVGYMLCSATLLISNKVAVHFLAAPSFILFAQLIGTVAVVQCAAGLGYIKVDKLEKKKIVQFSSVALIFISTIFLNMKALEHANVETFMVFRFSTPCVISVADYLFLGRQLPSTRSWLCLLVLLLGSAGYAMTDSSYEVKGYYYCALWYMTFCVDQVYLKHIINTVKMDSNWGRVFYSNLLAAIPMIFTFGGNSYEIDALKNITTSGIAAVAVSVILGAAMSYFAWSARAKLAATTFTVVGNVCKITTIAINMLIWDKHASATGIMCLFTCLAAAYFYKQAPLRKHDEDEEDGEVKGKEPLLPK